MKQYPGGIENIGRDNHSIEDGWWHFMLALGVIFIVMWLGLKWKDEKIESIILTHMKAHQSISDPVAKYEAIQKFYFHEFQPLAKELGWSSWSPQYREFADSPAMRNYLRSGYESLGKGIEVLDKRTICYLLKIPNNPNWRPDYEIRVLQDMAKTKLPELKLKNPRACLS